MLIFQEDRQFLWFFYTIYSISCSLFFAKVVVITIFLFLSPYSGIVIPDGDWQNKLKNMEFSEEVLFIEKFIWTKSNYKLMLGKWKIGIILEAGYQLLKSVENKESCVKLTDQIYFQTCFSISI